MFVSLTSSLLVYMYVYCIVFDVCFTFKCHWSTSHSPKKSNVTSFTCKELLFFFPFLSFCLELSSLYAGQYKLRFDESTEIRKSIEFNFIDEDLKLLHVIFKCWKYIDMIPCYSTNNSNMRVIQMKFWP